MLSTDVIRRDAREKMDESSNQVGIEANLSMEANDLLVSPCNLRVNTCCEYTSCQCIESAAVSYTMNEVTYLLHCPSLQYQKQTAERDQ